MPTASCFLCGTPRSGSWLLSSLLHSTGVAGRPHEYFFRDTEVANRRSWRVSSYSEYLQRSLQAGTSDSGVFASKLMWGYMPEFLERLKVEAGDEFGSDRVLVERFFPRPHFVFVWREDVVAQAVSWAKAIQTGYWHHWDTANAQPRFDFDQVDGLVRETTRQNGAWRDWFAANHIEPLCVRFEDLVEDKPTEALRVLKFLGVDLPAGGAVAEQTVKAGSEVDQEWHARYRLGRS